METWSCEWCFFFFNDTATTEIYTLSLHDALPISADRLRPVPPRRAPVRPGPGAERDRLVPRAARRLPAGDHLLPDRKSTRLNSSHANISYAVFCLKKKKITSIQPYTVIAPISISS